ncbi:hypothetical protein BgiMline_001468 [Biomphalaria glabrata]
MSRRKLRISSSSRHWLEEKRHRHKPIKTTLEPFSRPFQAADVMKDTHVKPLYRVERGGGWGRDSVAQATTLMRGGDEEGVGAAAYGHDCSRSTFTR